MSDLPDGRTPKPAILICDIQEKFRDVIHEFDKVVLTATKVLRAARILDLPVFVTTQNRARLGDTVAELRPYLDVVVGGAEGGDPAGGAPAPAPAPHPLVRADVDKTRFSMWGHPALAGALPPAPAPVVVLGIEAHVCVAQTALDALRDGGGGRPVHVLADGVSSRHPGEAAVALARLRAAGAAVTTSEAWLYEHVADAARPEFRAVVALVKDTAAATGAALDALVPARM